MQVYLSAIAGHVLDEMVKTLHAFLDFCYIARHDTHDTHSLAALDDALQQFYHHREIFRASGVHLEGFNLPRQHSFIHYLKLIRAYGAPNGLCSSIMAAPSVDFSIVHGTTCLENSPSLMGQWTPADIYH